MRRSPAITLGDHAPLIFPAAMLTLFFVVPFGIMIAVSFFQRQQGGFYEPAFVLANYERFLTAFFGGVLGFSLLLAAVVALCCVALAFPFTYLLTRLARKTQVLWLVGLLSVLSLSEVIIGFSWLLPEVAVGVKRDRAYHVAEVIWLNGEGVKGAPKVGRPGGVKVCRRGGA